MVVIDIETKNFFGSVTEDGVVSLSDLKISFAGAYDTEKDHFLSYWEDDLGKLEELMKTADMVVGFNSWAFDYGVLSSYFTSDPWSFPSIDLMVAMKKTVGFRPKLDDLAKANFGAGKIGKGSDAAEYWEKGELDKLEKYCLEDVRLTYEVWKLGEVSGKIKYFDKNGFTKETAIDWKNGFLQKKDEAKQGRLF